MNHYTYLLTFSDGMKYIGVHSTHINPELDTRYIGSGTGLPKRTPETCHKTILQVYNTRAEAVAAERYLIESNNCVKSNDYYNLRRNTHDRHGITADICIGTATAATKNRGKRNPAALASATRFTGDSRTPAQKAGQESMREKLTGVKNPEKGRSGTENKAFVPWYYITPSGNYVEIHDKTKAEMAEFFGVNQRQMIHRFHYTNMHQRATYPVLNGYTFDNLPRLIDTGTF